MTLNVNDLLPHQKAYVRKMQDSVDEKRRKVRLEEELRVDFMAAREEDGNA